MDERYFRFDNEEDVQLEFYLWVDAECRAPKRNTLLWDEWGGEHKKAHTQSVQCKRGMGEPIIHILFSSGGCSPHKEAAPQTNLSTMSHSPVFSSW